MNCEQPIRLCERVISEDGPILLWPNAPGDEQWGLLLEINVCPFPSCTERQVTVDGFLVESPYHSSVRPVQRSAEDGLLEKSELDWAFVVSVDIDPPGKVHVEECRDRTALRWFTDSLDIELRASLLKRFEKQRAEFDAVLGEEDAAPQDSTTFTMTCGRDGWYAIPIAPDRLDAIQADLERRFGDRRGFWRESFQRDPERVPKIGRNDLCPCGSGRKYKRCCLGSA